MPTATDIKSETPSEKLELLDAIIIKDLKNKLEQLNEGKEVKFGELIKMMELRIKSTPETAEQKKFWEMIDKIRKEKQPVKQGKNEKKKAD